MFTHVLFTPVAPFAAADADRFGRTDHCVSDRVVARGDDYASTLVPLRSAAAAYRVLVAGAAGRPAGAVTLTWGSGAVAGDGDAPGNRPWADNILRGHAERHGRGRAIWAAANRLPRGTLFVWYAPGVAVLTPPEPPVAPGERREQFALEGPGEHPRYALGPAAARAAFWRSVAADLALVRI